MEDKYVNECANYELHLKIARIYAEYYKFPNEVLDTFSFFTKLITYNEDPKTDPNKLACQINVKDFW